jgi:hypothetical protein
MGKQIAELLMDLRKNEYQFEQPRYMRTNADLFGMHLILPFIGDVMRITDHFSIRSSGSITDAKRSTTANEPVRIRSASEEDKNV